MPTYPPRVQTTSGLVEGLAEPGLLSFKGLPFAAPPVGALRWQPPQPVDPWPGVRPAAQFGPRAMQLPLFDDMIFRSNGMREDCLYLNVWTPSISGPERRPVLVYFYGGGFMAGDGSEPRYDGANLARQGIVTLTVNYRLNIFGFLAHPDGASGNYGLLDQAAALRWVRANIAAFGGDPQRITIAGESAGSSSVSLQMLAPFARDLIAGAIGSSGAAFGRMAPTPLAEAERLGLACAAQLGADSLADLRALPAERLLQATGDLNAWFSPTLDGVCLPRDPAVMFAAGEQARVPLLLGWNSEEMGPAMLLGAQTPTPENFTPVLRARFGERAEAALRLYPAATAEQARQSATDLASDDFTGYSTWKWSELHRQTSGAPVYRYFYTHPRPPLAGLPGELTAPAPRAGPSAANV